MSAQIPPPINVVTNDPDERSMAALGHASILLNLFIPGLGIIAAAAVWLTQRDRSAFASKQALQATVYQIVLALVPVFLGMVGFFVALAAFLTAATSNNAAPLVVVPIAIVGILFVLLLLLVGLLYGLVGAYEAYQGRDFRYWLIGDMLERR